MCACLCWECVCFVRLSFFFFLASLPVFLWLSAKWHKKQTDTYYAEHQRRALEGVHPREAYPATHNYTSAESTAGRWEQTGPVIEHACRFTGHSQRLHKAHTHWQLRSRYYPATLPQTRPDVSDCLFQPFFFCCCFFYFTRSEETVRMRFTHGLPRISWLTWLARQTVLARKSPGTNRTHVAHVPFLSLSPPGAHVACHPFLRKRERGQKISGY